MLQRKTWPSGFKLPNHSWVKISQVRILSVERIGELIDTASPEEMGKLIDGLNEIIA